MMVIVLVFSVWIRRLRPIPSRTLPRSTRTMTDSGQPSIVDLTAREPCRIFTFANHVTFEHSIGIPCPVLSSRREGNINVNKQTKLKSFLSRSSISQSASTCLCSGAPRPVGDLAGAATSLATESTGTVLTPSQMSEIAGHGDTERTQDESIV